MPGGQGWGQGWGYKRNWVSLPPLKNLGAGRAAGHGAGHGTSLALAQVEPKKNE